MRFSTILLTVAALFTGAMASAESVMIDTGPDERALKQTIIFEADIDTVWAMFTTSAGVSQWIAPVGEVDLRTGGAILTNYDACASIDDSRTITLAIVNFVPKKFLTLQSDLTNQREADWMSDEVYDRREQLYSMFEFLPLEDGRTQLVSWGLGYGKSEAWDEMIEFFTAGNEWTFDQLHKALAGEKTFDPCSE